MNTSTIPVVHDRLDWIEAVDKEWVVLEGIETGIQVLRNKTTGEFEVTEFSPHYPNGKWQGAGAMFEQVALLNIRVGMRAFDRFALDLDAVLSWANDVAAVVSAGRSVEHLEDVNDLAGWLVCDDGDVLEVLGLIDED